MIACQLREPPSRVIEVGPAIAGVYHKGFRTHDQGHCDRCSHRGPGELLVALVDGNVGPLHVVPEQFVPRGAFHLPRPHLWQDRVHNSLDSQAARLLTVHMTSYTIRDHKQTKGLPRSSNGALRSEHTIF